MLKDYFQTTTRYSTSSCEYTPFTHTIELHRYSKLSEKWLQPQIQAKNYEHFKNSIELKINKNSLQSRNSIFWFNFCEQNLLKYFQVKFLMQQIKKSLQLPHNQITIKPFLNIKKLQKIKNRNLKGPKEMFQPKIKLYKRAPEENKNNPLMFSKNKKGLKFRSPIHKHQKQQIQIKISKNSFGNSTKYIENQQEYGLNKHIKNDSKKSSKTKSKNSKNSGLKDPYNYLPKCSKSRQKIILVSRVQMHQKKLIVQTHKSRSQNRLNLKYTRLSSPNNF